MRLLKTFAGKGSRNRELLKIINRRAKGKFYKIGNNSAQGTPFLVTSALLLYIQVIQARNRSSLLLLNNQWHPLNTSSCDILDKGNSYNEIGFPFFWYMGTKNYLSQNESINILFHNSVLCIFLAEISKLIAI